MVCEILNQSLNHTKLLETSKSGSTTRGLHLIQTEPAAFQDSRTMEHKTYFIILESGTKMDCQK